MNQIKVGSILSYISMGLNIIIGLLYVPFLLRYLSVGEYGIYQMIGSLIAYLGIMDFGLSDTITRFYSQKIALNDEEGKENILAISAIIYFFLSLVVILVGYFLYQSIESIYSSKLSVHEIVIAKKMLILLIGSTAITIFSKVFIAAINSHEKFVFIRMVEIVKNLTQPIIVIAILSIRADALVLVQVQVVFNVLYILLGFWYAVFLLKIKIKLHSFDIRLVSTMISFSLYIFIQIIMDLFIWRTGSLILGAVVGSSAVAIYSIAIQINMYYKQLSTAFGSVLFPKISRIAALSNDMSELNNIFIKIGRLQYSILGLVVIGFALFGEIFLQLWIGDDFLPAYAMTLIIMIPFSFDLIENTGIIILQAKNLHRTRSYIFIIIAIMNILLSYIFARSWGEIGCAIALGLSLFLGHAVGINLYYHKIGLPVLHFFKQIGKLSIPLAIVYGIGLIYLTIVSIVSWSSLLVSIIIISSIYFAMLWFLGFNSYEKHLIQSMFVRLKKGS